MTLAASSNKAGPFSGDGVTTQFPYTFGINTTDGSDIYVYVIDSTGVVTLLTSNYSVDVANARVNYPTVAGVSPLASGVAALPAGWKLVLLRVEPVSQILALTNQGTFDAPSIMTALDKIVMISQQLQEQIDRCYKTTVDKTASPSDVSAFIAAISATFPPFSSDTYANLKLLSAGAPTTRRLAFATDSRQLCFYTGNTVDGDAGWITIPISMFNAAGA